MVLGYLLLLKGDLFGKRFSSYVYIFCAILNHLPRVIDVTCANSNCAPHGE